MVENCFLKQPKELALEDVETNFGFLFLAGGAGEVGDKEKDKDKEGKEAKESKGEEKLLSNILHKESKQASEASKYFGMKDITPLVPQLLALLGEMAKHLDPKDPVAKGIEMAEIVMLVSKLVRLGNEEIHNFLIKSQMIDKSIVRAFR